MYFMSNLLFMEIYGIILDTKNVRRNKEMYTLESLKRFLNKMGEGYLNSTTCKESLPKKLQGTLYSNDKINKMVLHLIRCS